MCACLDTSGVASIEHNRNYTFLTKDKIIEYLTNIMLSDADDIKTRKLIVNTFIREVIYYEDRVIITYNFSDTINTDKATKEHIEEIERQSNSAVNSNPSSCLDLPCPPPATIVEHIGNGCFFML